jgi:hypothetical protein
MSNNKQSSVDWLVKELNQKIDFIPMNKWDEIKEVIDQAKAMHKHEIMAAYDTGNQNQYDKINFEDYLNVDEEQYYNETYGGNNEQQ